jgi:NADH-quinone oxidoreductase subunit E
MPLSEQGLTKARELIARYPSPRSAMLPLLFLAQAEEGYVSPAGVAEVAELLGVTRAEVGAVATFYTMFHRRPAGRYVVSVCRTLSCQLRGSDQVSEAICERLGVALGGTTPDRKVTVEEVECLAACDGAPVLQVNYENYERVTPEQAVELVERLLAGEVPPPTFARDGSVTEPASAAAYWRLADPLGGEPPVRLAGNGTGPRPEPPDGQVGAAGSESESPGGRRPAQEPQPEREEPGVHEPAREGQPGQVAREAGPHQREAPGGEPQ